MVDVNRMTVKVQEALQQAGGIAARRNHQGIDVEHLLMALLAQDGALGPALLEAAGVAPRAVRDALERELARRPQVRGAAAGPSPPSCSRSAISRCSTSMPWWLRRAAMPPACWSAS